MVLATATACGPLNTDSSSPAAQATTQSDATTAAPKTDPGNDDDTFCELAKQKGIENLAADPADPAQTKQILQNIDELAAAAPSDIHADFATFDKVEHALLEPGGGGAQSVNGAEVRGALTHVSTYLKNTCHITMQDQ